MNRGLLRKAQGFAESAGKTSFIAALVAFIIQTNLIKQAGVWELSFYVNLFWLALLAAMVMAPVMIVGYAVALLYYSLYPD